MTLFVVLLSHLSIELEYAFLLMVLDVRACNDVFVEWKREVENCNDIMHYNDGQNFCNLATCQGLNRISYGTELPPGFQCQHGFLVVTPGYWYITMVYENM